MRPSAPAILAVGVAVAGALVAAITVVARSRSEPPARCAPGMMPLGPRCCGEGQHFDAGRCAGTPTRCALGLSITSDGCVAEPRVVRLEAGTLRIGPGDWEAQGSVEPRVEPVRAFSIDAYEVTEGRYASCVAADACSPLPLSNEPGRALASASLDEAARFCAWSGGALPTSSELAFATAGPRSRRYAWGDTGAVCRRAAWGLREGPCGEGATGPEIAGSHPDGASPEGIHDLSGNVAEWTRPADPAAAWTEVRGGSWADGAASALRSWHRRVVSADARSPEIGFRCVYPAP